MTKKLTIETATPLEILDNKLVQATSDYQMNMEHFRTKGVKVAGTRARKALGQIRTLSLELRKAIQVTINAAA